MFRRLFVFFAFALAFAGPAAAQDAADAIVRLNRLESQFRQLSGQMEQLQYENRQLKDQLRKFQEDVEFRFQDSRGGSRPSSSSPSATPSRPAPAQPQPAPAQPQRRSDVFDPSETPDAPGAPRPLGSTPPSAPLAADAGRPMALPGGQLAGIGDLIEQDGVEGAPMDGTPHDRMAALPQGAIVERPGPSVAATSVGNPRADFDAAYASFSQKQYDQAEMGFRRFLQSNPRDKLVPEATFWLGESLSPAQPLPRGRGAVPERLGRASRYAQGPRRPAAARHLAERDRRQGPRLRRLRRARPQVSAGLRARPSGLRPRAEAHQVQLSR